GRTLRYPGAFVQASDSPLKHLGPSPTVGQHTAQVLAEARESTSAKPTPRPASTEPVAPLAGLKVVDLTWYMAGPSTTRMLADWGATVVRVESVARPDGGRGSGPALNGRHGPDSGGYSLTHNSGKLGLAVNLTRPESRAVLEDLVRWADVAVVGYSPRAARNLRLDYGSLSAVNPQLIMLSTCLMGQTGPLAEFAGFGNLSAAIAGFYEIGGWADRPPIGPYLAYTDVVAPRFSFCSVLAALEHRERTGRGQLLDLSQAESTAHLLSPAVLDVQVNGRVAGRHGNDDDHAAPHGVYPANGEDRWVAIACPDDRSWQALAGAMGRADLAGDPALATLAGRIEQRRELDEAVAAWTSSLTAAEVQDCLQALGVPAHELLDSAGCWADPQLQHRGHFQELSHPLHGTVRVQGPRLHFSRTATSVHRAAPPLGEDTFEVLHDLLGYDDDRIAELAAAEVLE
ncbi:MAG: hypothetical protein QOJ19_102, partial [Acidimicrobiia bacterium]|nr:hypothetical protein [Acidimicrobiia bacterium]